MKTAPKKIQNRAIKTACRYRDAVVAGEGSVTPDDMYELTDERNKAFQDLVAAMGCTDAEVGMVSETLGDIVRQTPVKPLSEK